MESSTLSVESFATKHLELLELERDAEVEENRCLRESCSVKELQKRGIGIANLCVCKVSTGLYGRTLLKFQLSRQKRPLPSNTITSGDIVGAGTYEGGRLSVVTSGVVLSVSDTSLTVAFDDEPDLNQETLYTVVKLANDVTYKRLKRVLKVLFKCQEHPLLDVLFNGKEPSSYEEDPVTSFINSALDDAQQSAVRFAMRQRHLAVVHGPPGTGKTTTVVECILQAVKFKNKVLACAPSNIAVDNLLERLCGRGVKVVRLGHPGRSLPALRPHCLDALVTNYDGSDVIREMRTEIDQLRTRVMKSRGSGERRVLRGEQRSLQRELRDRERRIITHALKNADVVLATLTSSADDGPLRSCVDHFDLCVIDECSQATEAACWIPLLRCRRCILAGDHCQLPPTIISKEAANKGLQVSLLERVASIHPSSVRMLTTQYRMHEDIMHWPSRRLYEGKLEAHSSVQHHLLCHLLDVEVNEDTSTPLLLIDTAPLGLREIVCTDEGGSRGNEGEADVACAHARRLLRSGLRSDQVGVITPYSLQAELIRSRLVSEQIEVKSVDGFQGREKEAIILSLVRSNEAKEIGFLTEDRRINVAITRARRHLAVVCDTSTVSSHEFLRDFVDYCEKNGDYRTAFEYENDIGVSVRGFQPKDTKEKKKNKTKPNQKDKSSTRHSEEEIRAQEAEYSVLLEKFAGGSEDCLPFPATLTAFERRCLHEVAERMGLVHVSSGEGTGRFIEIWKTGTKPPLREQITAHKELDKNEENDVVSSIVLSGATSVNTDLEHSLELSSGSSVVNSELEHSTEVLPATDVTKLEHSLGDSPATITVNSNLEHLSECSSATTSNKNTDLEHSLGDSSATVTAITELEHTSKVSSVPAVVNTELKQISTENSKIKPVPLCEKKQITSDKFSSRASKANLQDTEVILPPTAVESTLLGKHKVQTKKKGKGKTSKPQLKALPLHEEDDFDTMLAKVVQADKICRFEKCKTSVAILVQVCSLCGHRFCCSHSMPELHGCGEAVRAQARRMRNKKDPPRTDPARQAYLHRKLDKRINEMAGQRHKKPESPQ